MNNKLLLGRFIPDDSFIHQLDPRNKIIISLIYITLVLLANNFVSYLFLFLLIMIGVRLSQIKISYFLNGLKGLLWLLIFTVILQLFFSNGAHSYFHFGLINISQEGIILSVYTLCRFTLIIFVSTLLTLTTSPLALADAVEKMLAPLEKLKFPAHEVALMLSIALRFIPTLMDEATTIIKAQQARGVDFQTGSLLKRAKALIPIFIPLLVNSFTRAEQLADAMEARGYQGQALRSHYRALKWQGKDTLMLLITLLSIAIIIVIRN